MTGVSTGRHFFSVKITEVIYLNFNGYCRIQLDVKLPVQVCRGARTPCCRQCPWLYSASRYSCWRCKRTGMSSLLSRCSWWRCEVRTGWTRTSLESQESRPRTHGLLSAQECSLLQIGSCKNNAIVIFQKFICWISEKRWQGIARGLVSKIYPWFK